MTEKIKRTTCLPLIRSSYHNLTKTEQKIADIILENPTKVMQMTINELSETSTGAEASIFRFCRKLGFSGFQGLKQALAGDLFTPKDAISKEMDESDTPEDVTQKVFHNIINALLATEKMLNYKELEKAINLVVSAKQIEVYGYGGSGIIASDIEHRFMRFGLPVHAYADPHMQIASAALLDENALVIGISHTGASIDLLKSLKVAKSNNAKIIVITSYLKSPATELADVVLAGIAKETGYCSEAMASRLVHLSIVDALYSGIMLKCMDSYIDNMAKVREAIAQEKI